jgi:hypothetical protein
MIQANIQSNIQSKVIDIYLASMTSRKITQTAYLSALKLYQTADRSEQKLIKHLESKITNGAIQIKGEGA